MSSLRIFTGTPCNFDGTQDFFDRESGLTARGFESIGVSTGAITLGPQKAGDLPMMLRASLHELESTSWWSQRHLDALIFYTWGNPNYQRMVSAAKSAEIKVAQVTDAQGIISPLTDWKAHVRSATAHYWHEPMVKRCLRTLIKLPYSHTLRILTRDLPMARNLCSGDFFFAATPSAKIRYQKLVKYLIGDAAQEKICFIPIPVNFHFAYEYGETKENEVIAVGRWDSTQKRTPLLMSTISHVLGRNPEVKFQIYGATTPGMEGWRNQMCSAWRERIFFHGKVANAELAAAYRRARVMLVSSAYEGCHNASAEAVCSGATVVACRSPYLDAVAWHAGKNSGRLAEHSTPEILGDALLMELQSWERGERSPLSISQSWSSELHPDRVAHKILQVLDLKRNHIK
jgi:glycosyltransferase involved in cell wall biosynthesis